jgi:RNA polymerase sigma factor (sigma-70 family)
VGELHEFNEILEGARRGREDAVAELYRQHTQPVLARIRSRLTPELRRRYDSLDIAHSVMVELLQNLDRFQDRGEVAFRRWLYTTAENSIRSKLRRMRDVEGTSREIPLSNAVEQTARSEKRGPATDAGDRDERVRLRHLIDEMEERHREILRLRLDERCSFAEIAERLGAPCANAARMRYARALGVLREKWGRLRRGG